MAKIPFVIVGDGPNEPTGLGRIARDLAASIVSDPVLGPQVDLLHIGGPSLPYFDAWPHLSMGEAERGDDWGCRFVETAYRLRWGSTPGICWVIWDPSRLAAYAGIDLPVQLWSYPAIDAGNRAGQITGPARAALHRADRVIAYGRWASTVLKASGLAKVAYLPHGITTAISYPADDQDLAWARTQFGPHCHTGDRVIGCVATNQPRKDLSLVCGALDVLRLRGHKVFGWLHTDTLVKAWSVPQLVEDFGLQKRIGVTLVQYDDRQLACLYQACSVTIAPGLGEGFGYPIVESLANGIPVVHVDRGGGRELIPKREWRFPVRDVRLEGIYAVERPVCHAEDVANAIERIWRWEDAVGPVVAHEYCRGAVAHLDWSALWGRWRSWIRQGIEG